MAKEQALTIRAAVALGAALTLSACAGSAATNEPKVWSSSSSADGFANCPGGTVVVGGGHEIAESMQAPGKMPIVVASRPYGNGWRVTCTDDRGVATAGCKAWAVCASVLK